MQGEDAQTVDAFFPPAGDASTVDNGENDIAVAGVWHLGARSLYVAITTTGFLESNRNFGDAGTNDIVIKRFGENLDEDESTQLGGEGDDIVTAIAADNTVQLDFVIVGSTDVTVDDTLFGAAPGNSTNWFIATMDASDLSVTSSYVNGTEFDAEQATAVVIDPESESPTSYYVAGTTFGEYFEENAGSDNDEDVGQDAWVVKISSFDIDDEPEWGIQFGTAAYDEPTAIVASGTNVYVVGTTRDLSSVLSASDEEDTPAIFVVALDGSDGDEIWGLDEFYGGNLTMGTEAHGAVLNEDGTELFVSGHTRGIIPGYDGEATGSDELFVISIDTEDGSVNWVWQSEANATALGTGGIVMADDGVSPIVGAIAFGNQFNLTFTYWEDGSGDMIAAKIDPDELEVTKYFVAPAASTETREQPMAMVKDPNVVDGVYLIGKQDGDFGDEDVVPEPDPDSESDENLSNYLALRVKLEVFPEEDDEDDGWDFPYWYVGVPVFAIGGVLFLVAYKWAAASQRAKEKQATMV